ncbi:hypothetical protein BJ508DRAFT_303791 [Ascobolus immersus RN42]|uniref:Uncharacterized protein n=1 Tax=Ascobolus immersus RN42 TaxID=1160509 RepID=A0A3N4IDT7_ASCIM|nr:hypothetical protein BJ508DRAFT_303791 [Ascobolus immersus RN42]
MGSNPNASAASLEALLISLAAQSAANPTSTPYEPPPQQPPNISFTTAITLRLKWCFSNPHLHDIRILTLTSPQAEPVIAPLFDEAGACIHDFGAEPATFPPMKRVRCFYDLVQSWEQFPDMDGDDGEGERPGPVDIFAEGEFVTVRPSWEDVTISIVQYPKSSGVSISSRKTIKQSN